MTQRERVRDKLHREMSKNFDISTDIVDRLYPSTERISLFIVINVSIENKVKRKYKTIFKNVIIPEEFFSSQKPMDAEISEIVNEHFEELL